MEFEYPKLGSTVSSWLLYPFKWIWTIIILIIASVIWVVTNGIKAIVLGIRFFFTGIGIMFSDLF